jgi:hypothetical protein
MEITPEMLEAIKAVKGKANPALWDPRCASYMAKNAVKTASKPKKKEAELVEPEVELLDAVND